MVYDARMTRHETLQRGAGVAVWKQIAERLRTEISLDVWKTHDKLPSESELASRFGVNRHTVRRAVAALAEEGILQATQGRGTFVAQKPISYPISHRTRFSENVSAQAREPGGRLIRHYKEPANDRVREKLSLDLGTVMLAIETVRFADSIPISTSTTWFVADRFPNLVASFKKTGSITSALAENGVDDYTRRETCVSAGLATAHEARILAIDPGDPVLFVESVNADQAGDSFNFTHGCFVAARVQLTFES